MTATIHQLLDKALFDCPGLRFDKARANAIETMLTALRDAGLLIDDHIHDFSFRRIRGFFTHRRRTVKQTYGCCECGLSEPMHDLLAGAGDIGAGPVSGKKVGKK